MADVTNIRQAETAVKVMGILAEKNLKIEKENNIDKITGYLTIKTSDINFIRFNVNCSSKKKDGGDNSMYAGLVTVMNEYKAIADDGVGEENADKIYVDTTTNKTYRWSGSQYTEISESLALGETSSTAYPGDKGALMYGILNDLVSNWFLPNGMLNY